MCFHFKSIYKTIQEEHKKKVTVQLIKEKQKTLRERLALLKEYIDHSAKYVEISLDDLDTYIDVYNALVILYNNMAQIQYQIETNEIWETNYFTSQNILYLPIGCKKEMLDYNEIQKTYEEYHNILKSDVNYKKID